VFFVLAVMGYVQWKRSLAERRESGTGNRELEISRV